MSRSVLHVVGARPNFMKKGARAARPRGRSGGFSALVGALTLRDNTERPVTSSHGTNQLVGSNPDALPAAVDAILAGRATRGSVPELWEGKAGARAASAIKEFVA